MENTPLSKYTVSFGLSLMLASLINAIIVIAKESSPAVMAGMKSMSGHHWVTHSAIVLVIFVGFGLIFARSRGGLGIEMTAKGLIKTLVSGVIISSILIGGFYLIGD
jgi:hypothetical protein